MSIKQFLISTALTGFFAIAPTLASAQTCDISCQIAAIQQQILNLQAQIVQLQNQASQELRDGDRVKTVVYLNVRSTPSISGTIIAVAPSGSMGTIICANAPDMACPKTTEGYTWWYIDWDSSSFPTGWSAEGGSEAQFLIKEASVLTDNPSIPTIITTNLPNAVTNQAYSASISATGGTGSYTWTLSSGSLPTGLVLQQLNCVTTPCQVPIYIVGTPTTNGTYTFTIQVSATGVTASRTFTITTAGTITTVGGIPTVSSVSTFPPLPITLGSLVNTLPYFNFVYEGESDDIMALDRTKNGPRGPLGIGSNPIFRFVVPPLHAPFPQSATTIIIDISQELVFTMSAPGTPRQSNPFLGVFQSPAGPPTAWGTPIINGNRITWNVPAGGLSSSKAFDIMVQARPGTTGGVAQARMAVIPENKAELIQVMTAKLAMIDRETFGGDEGPTYWCDTATTPLSSCVRGGSSPYVGVHVEQKGTILPKKTYSFRIEHTCRDLVAGGSVYRPFYGGTITLQLTDALMLTGFSRDLILGTPVINGNMLTWTRSNLIGCGVLNVDAKLRPGAVGGFAKTVLTLDPTADGANSVQVTEAYQVAGPDLGSDPQIIGFDYWGRMYKQNP